MSGRRNVGHQNVLQVGRALSATLDGASRLGKAVYATWEQLTNPVSPGDPLDLEDGWQIVDDADFSDWERPVRPRAKLRTVEEMKKQETEFETASEDLSTARSGEEAPKKTSKELVRRYREIEKKLKKAIMRGDEVNENKYRTQLSHCRQKISNKETEESGGWAVASTYGYTTYGYTTYGSMADTRDAIFNKINAAAMKRSIGHSTDCSSNPLADSMVPPADIVTEPPESQGAS